MVYIPNPTDPTQPTGNVDASTADDEFRALKGYVLGLALAAGMFSPVRQCANDGVVDANGNAAIFTAAGAGGLALDLKATARPLVANFAGGSTGTGVADRNGTYTADVAGIVAGLAPSNTNYIFADYVSAGVWTWQNTLAPPQYGRVYPQTIGSVLQFGGAAGSTVFLDDFGNTWTAQGGAKVQTNQFKFGTGGLGGAGAANALNGAADYIKSVNFTSFGSGSWFMRCWVNPSALPGAAVGHRVMSFVNAAFFGAEIMIFNNAGTVRFAYSLSSLGAAADIASTVQGTTLPVVGTTYFVELTYDALAGVYRLYVNGAQEASTASAARVCAFTAVGIGAGGQGQANSFLNGYIDKPEFGSYCSHPGGTAYAVPTAAPSITAVGYAPDYFDFQGMKMYSVSAASGVAGTAPALTQKYRCYFGEADTGAVVPSAVRSYAFNGKFISTDQTYSSGGALVVSVVHNLGVVPQVWSAFLRNIISEQGWVPGDIVTVNTVDNAANATTINLTKSNILWIVSNGLGYNHKTTGARVGLAGANWKVVIQCSRGWGGA